VILVDGALHEGSTAPFDYADRGLTLGDGLFETMIAFDGRVHRLDDHLDRIGVGLSTIGMVVPRARLAADVGAMAARTGATGGVLRLTVTRGAGARGLAPPDHPNPTVIVSLAPFDPRLMMQPVTLAVANTVRRNDRSPASRLKTLGYLDHILALAEARRAGAGDALVLDTRDRVACASVANVFRIVAGRLETPPLTDAVLPGVIRARVLSLADTAGLVAVERSLSVADLMAADAVFLTNSVRLAQPVTAIDGQGLAEVGRGQVAVLFAALAADVAAGTGTDPRGVA
jgi:branched-chain amino acid aminotransferase